MAISNPRQSTYNEQRLSNIIANTIKAASLKPGEKDPTLQQDVHDLISIGMGVDLTPRPSAARSIASRIFAAQGRLLPVEAEAFFASEHESSFEEVCNNLKLWSKANNPRELYQRLGISVQTPQDNLPGWYRCQLPDGWYAEQDTPTIGYDERIAFYDHLGELQFDIICLKDATAQCISVSLSRSQRFL